MTDFAHWLARIHWIFEPKVLVQILMIGYALLWVWRRIIGTQAERLVKGLLVLVVICFISALLGLNLITSILQHLIPTAMLGLLITFQPEIRRGLGYLGRVDKFKIDLSLRNHEVDKSQRDIEQIIAAVKKLSKQRTGALIVVEPPTGERDYLSPGTKVDADISTNLLLTLFFPKSPLHDGAVVLRQHKIVAAGVILPMSGDPKLSTKYGTRHRAAIGLSELYDGLCIVVSEETGSISAANRGMLVRYNSAEELAAPLSYIYDQPSVGSVTTPWQAFANWFNRSNSSGNKTIKPVLLKDVSKSVGDESSDSNNIIIDNVEELDTSVNATAEVEQA
jgi:diadenylate cyclase